MKTDLYVPKVKRVEVTLTFLVSGLPEEVNEGHLYDILAQVSAGHEGARTISGRGITTILEGARAATKKAVA